MITRDQFEGALREASDARYGTAGVAPDLRESSGLEAEAIAELLAAFERLKDDPSIFSGDPQGVYSYEDPVLAVAAYWARVGMESAALTATAGRGGEDLRKSSLWSWMVTGVRAWLHRRSHSRVNLGGLTPRKPVVVTTEPVRIAITGDAGYQGNAQARVVRMIQERHSLHPFHFVIHLGDIYFGGGEQEVLRHFLAPFSAPLKQAGARVFTLLGNHDLYYGADGYVSALKILEQPGRYFLIETPRWNLACLDTSLAAEHFLGNDAQLDDGQLGWLDDLLRNTEAKPLLLMSHHFIISGWHPPARSLLLQLRDRIWNKVFAWYWGHEHVCAVYDRSTNGFYGACIGNGAFLEEWKALPSDAKDTPEWYAQGRCDCSGKRTGFWPHGFLEMELRPGQIAETYHLEGGESHQRVLNFPLR